MKSMSLPLPLTPRFITWTLATAFAVLLGDDAENGTGLWTMTGGFTRGGIAKNSGSYSFWSGAGNDLQSGMRLTTPLNLAGMAGNYAGSHVALKRGAWVIRPMLFTVSAALLAKVAWDMFR